MAARKKKVVQAKARIRQTLCDLRQQQDAFHLYVQGINKKTDEALRLGEALLSEPDKSRVLQRYMSVMQTLEQSLAQLFLVQIPPSESDAQDDQSDSDCEDTLMSEGFSSGLLSSTTLSKSNDQSVSGTQILSKSHDQSASGTQTLQHIPECPPAESTLQISVAHENKDNEMLVDQTEHSTDTTIPKCVIDQSEHSTQTGDNEGQGSDHTKILPLNVPIQTEHTSIESQEACSSKTERSDSFDNQASEQIEQKDANSGKACSVKSVNSNTSEKQESLSNIELRASSIRTLSSDSSNILQSPEQSAPHSIGSSRDSGSDACAPVHTMQTSVVRTETSGETESAIGGAGVNTGNDALNVSDNMPYGLGPMIPVLQMYDSQYVDVIVTEIFSPSLFWVQPLSDALDNLSTQLEFHYSKVHQRLKLNFEPRIGMVVCALFPRDDCWYRARILNVNKSDRGKAVTVEVFYVDYGNRETVPVEGLCTLEDQFASLPCQAFCCALNQVIPANGRKTWDKSQTDTFTALAINKQLHAVVSVVQKCSFVFLDLIHSEETLDFMGCQETGVPSHKLTLSNISSIMVGKGKAKAEVNDAIAGKLLHALVPKEQRRNYLGKVLKDVIDIQSPRIRKRQESGSSTSSGSTALGSINTNMLRDSLSDKLIKNRSVVASYLSQPTNTDRVDSDGKVHLNSTVTDSSVDGSLEHEISQSVTHEDSNQTVPKVVHVKELNDDSVQKQVNEKLVSATEKLKNLNITTPLPKEFEKWIRERRSQNVTDSFLDQTAESSNSTTDQIPSLQTTDDGSGEGKQSADVKNQAEANISNTSLPKGRRRIHKIRRRQLSDAENPANVNENVTEIATDCSENSSLVQLNSKSVSHESCSSEDKYENSGPKTSPKVSNVRGNDSQHAISDLSVRDISRNFSAFRQNSKDSNSSVDQGSEASSNHGNKVTNKSDNSSGKDTSSSDKVHESSKIDKSMSVDTKHQDTPIGNGNTETSKYSLLSIKIPEDGCLEVMMSFISSPGRFYVHFITKDSQRALDELMDNLSRHYEHDASHASSSLERIHPLIGNACCARFTDDNKYYRAEIVGIRCEAGIDGSSGCTKIKVLYVDFGNSEWLSVSRVGQLHPSFFKLPAQAVLCSLAGITPVTGTDEQSADLWSEEACNMFTEKTGFSKALLAFVQDKEKPVLRVNRSEALPVILMDTTGSDDICINRDMVKNGYAKLQEDAASLIFTGIIQKTDGAVEKTVDAKEATNELDGWDPMAEEFLSDRNSYAIDVDDPGVATVGYKGKDEHKICRFYKKHGTCQRGDFCPFRHILDQGGITTDKTEVFCLNDTENSIIPPEVDDWVAVEISAVFNPAHFYVIFPCGTKSLMEFMKEDSSTDDGYEDSTGSSSENLEALMENMNDFYATKTLRDRDLTVLALGEIVVARYKHDDSWYRARVIETEAESKMVQVFYVDYGNKEWVSESRIRLIEPHFLTLPFQALECFLPLDPVSQDGKWSKESRQLFRKFTDGQILFAHILSRSFNKILTLDLYNTTDSDVHINQLLVDKGHAKLPKASQKRAPPTDTVPKPRLIPG